MLTYEDVTGLFLKAAASLSLATHSEYWLNTRSVEREFTCTCHVGNCEEAEQHSVCTISFSWGPLDTALSLEGPVGVCDFFHEPEQDCPHLRTHAIPPLVLDLSYTLPLNGVMIAEDALLSLTQLLRLRASEHSRRTVESRPGVNMVLQDNRLQPDTLMLQQRVELPIWHPEGLSGLHEDPQSYAQRTREKTHSDLEDEGGEIVADDPHPEEWLPQVMVEVCQDVVAVLEALDATIFYNTADNVEQ